jgi:DNA replication factor GINS
MVGLDDLRKVLLSERETGRLTQIPQDLFDRTHTAVSNLLSKVYAIEDPLSDEARSIIEETMSIRETADDIFVIRAKKIITLAESQAQGNYIDRDETKRMIPPEREMFDCITSAIGLCQNKLFTNIHQSLVVEHNTDLSVTKNQPPSHESTATPLSSPPLSPQYTLVKVLADIDSFMGIDGRIYTLTQGDIVMLPERNAEVLVERNIALNMNLSK